MDRIKYYLTYITPGRVLTTLALAAVVVASALFAWAGDEIPPASPEPDLEAVAAVTPEPREETAPAATAGAAAAPVQPSGPEETPAPEDERRAGQERQVEEEPDPEAVTPEPMAQAAQAAATPTPTAAPRAETDGASVTPSPSAPTCTLSVRCDTLAENLSLLDENKRDLVPEDGELYPARTVTFTAGETVFDVLQREMRAAGIHMESSWTPAYDSAYIQGIGNLYEFDGGSLSGWVYSVNGRFPNLGCAQYVLEDGDVVEWLYTCDLGRDVGGDAGGVG